MHLQRLDDFVLYHIAIKSKKNGYEFSKNDGETVAVVQSMKSVLK